MKLNLHSIFLILLLSISQIACKTTTTEVVILLDLTEETFNHISINDFRSISSLEKDVFNGEEVRIQPITENGFNGIESYKIKSVISPLIGNEYQRRNELNKFYYSIDSTFQILKQGRSRRNGSVIFKILSEELNRLNESDADSKVLIINSDLMENSFIDFTNSVLSLIHI